MQTLFNQGSGKKVLQDRPKPILGATAVVDRDDSGAAAPLSSSNGVDPAVAAVGRPATLGEAAAAKARKVMIAA